MNFLDALFNVRRVDWVWLGMGIVVLLVAWGLWVSGGELSANPYTVKIGPWVSVISVIAGVAGLLVLMVAGFRIFAHEKELLERCDPWV